MAMKRRLGDVNSIDPMSPFLFLIWAEGFTTLLNLYGGDYIDRGIRVSPRSPWIDHLLFSDDSLIFMRANEESTKAK
jgi:hypothetical protein